MQTISREVFIPGRDGRPVFPGFVSYVSATEPLLIHRSGWVDASDTYDDFADRFSTDNGATWSEPVVKLQSHLVPEGRVRYAENACFFDRDTGKLLTFCSRGLYPGDHLDVDGGFHLTWDVYDPATGAWRGEEVIPHDLPGGLQISFCFPLKTRSGKLLVPAMTILRDAEGNARHYPGHWAPLETSFTLIGEPESGGGVRWIVGRPVEVDPEQSSRGFSENALAELAGGRIAMVMRGDNLAYPERLGHKWLAFSEDEGLTWSAPEPLGCADGEPIESGSNGCALVRSFTDGQLYFIGNLAADGERAKGNWPRSPLVIVQVQEEPFALRRETITEIDRRQPGEPPLTQMSNFRFYQDRLTGDMVVFLSRFGEKDPDNFKLADYYRYRVALD
ncbi:glycoside hydrolase [bacterium]|nr:glycoside hydrolase [bacterium]